MNSRKLVFTGPGSVSMESEELSAPGGGQVLVQARLSAISAGTELLLYRGEVLSGVRLDESLSALSGRFEYPVAYGYAVVGEVLELGAEVEPSWQGRRVFSFQPHRSHFVTSCDELHPVPDEVSDELASLFPTVETAVNLVLDTHPNIGERALVVGQGLVGLATTTLLAHFPLQRLWTSDPISRRQELSIECGAERSLAPADLRESEEKDFDFAVEVSGSPDGLNLAIQATGFEGRVIVGSWYGTKEAVIDLGTHFHRGRLRLLSSQVTHLAPGLGSRWSRSRRQQLAWQSLLNLPKFDWVSHRFPLEQAGDAYRLLANHPEQALQVLLTYS